MRSATGTLAQLPGAGVARRAVQPGALGDLHREHHVLDERGQLGRAELGDRQARAVQDFLADMSAAIAELRRPMAAPSFAAGIPG